MSDFKVGQVVRLTGDVNDRHFPVGEVYEVESATDNEVKLANESGRTRWVWDYQIEATDQPARRRLGTKPEGDDTIAADDPRIAWLWQDAERYATKRGYCEVYDEIVECLGIPGRERDFSFDAIIDGVGQLYATITARTQGEAKAKFDARVEAIKATVV